jgi:hypothetical protein
MKRPKGDTKDMAQAQWLTFDELIAETGVPPVVIERGLESGMLRRWTRTVHGERRFAPDTSELVNWSSWLMDDVISGSVSMDLAFRRLWRRALRGPRPPASR